MVKLTDSEMIEDLRAINRIRKGRIARVTPTQAPPRARIPCRCGRCARCLDDARWDRIFRQKFADPYYYAVSPPRGGSPLSSFR